MTAADPVASRLLDRTDVCGARRGTRSQREKVTGRAFDRQIGSTKRGDRYADCRIRTEFAFDRYICYATRDRKWLSGESRLSAFSGLREAGLLISPALAHGGGPIPMEAIWPLIILVIAIVSS